MSLRDALEIARNKGVDVILINEARVHLNALLVAFVDERRDCRMFSKHSAMKALALWEFGFLSISFYRAVSPSPRF